MSQYSNISNEQNELVNILQNMYNDNNHQINDMTTSINNLRNTNTQIRNIIVQILNQSNTSQSNTSQSNTSQSNTSQSNTSQSNTSQSNTRHYNRRNNNLTQVSQRQPTNRQVNGRGITYLYDDVQYIPYTTNRNTRFVQNFLEPVQVYPTQSQIEIATRNAQYSDILNPMNRSCPISLEIFNDTDIVVMIRFCGHLFKPDQIRTWFRSNCRCPVCRYDIRNYNLNTPINNEEIPLAQSDISNNFVGENESSSIDQSFSTQVDISNNFFEVNNSSIPNEERTNNRINTIATYLDLIFDNTSFDTNNNNYLLNEFTTILDTTDTNAMLSLFNNALRRTR